MCKTKAILPNDLKGDEDLQDKFLRSFRQEFRAVDGKPQMNHVKERVNAIKRTMHNRNISEKVYPTFFKKQIIINSSLRQY